MGDFSTFLTLLFFTLKALILLRDISVFPENAWELSGPSVGVHFDVNLTAIAATFAGIERTRFEGFIVWAHYLLTSFLHRYVHVFV